MARNLLISTASVIRRRACCLPWKVCPGKRRSLRTAPTRQCGAGRYVFRVVPHTVHDRFPVVWWIADSWHVSADRLTAEG